jgi:hypothetical protein
MSLYKRSGGAGQGLVYPIPQNEPGHALRVARARLAYIEHLCRAVAAKGRS